jgi:hypothetical protein
MEQLNRATSEAEIAVLAELKLPLIVRDYERYLEASARQYARLHQLRGWEIALVSALTVVLLTRSPVPVAAGRLLYVIIVMFMLTEAGIRAALRRVHRSVKHIEAKFQTTSVDELRQHFATWQFGTTHLAAETGMGEMFKQALIAISRPAVVLWHGSFALAVWAVMNSIAS